MIDFDEVSFWYPGAVDPTLSDVSLHVAEGELALLIGLTGSGKSTLLRAVNGLVPRFSGGHLEGRVVAAGRDTRTHPAREYADAVGVVGQDPLAGFVSDTVTEELAYGMEQLAMGSAVMRRRVEEMLDVMGLARLRGRALRSLSGGEQQRVAIGAALTCSPRVLVLDEPTSALDPVAAEEVLAVMVRLVHDLAMTVLVAEHRLERVIGSADTIVLVDGQQVRSGPPAEIMRDAPLAPPVVELGRLAGWDPLPLTVRDARGQSAPLRQLLSGSGPHVPSNVSGQEVLVGQGVTVSYGSRPVLDGVDVAVHAGEVVALMGRNGSGKSSLLWALQGAGRRTAGKVRAQDAITLVPQQAGDLLFRTTVTDECSAADRAHAVPPGTAAALFQRLTGSPRDPSTHPRDLSEGQRLALALAVQLAGGPSAVLLDEPTRGLDYAAKHELGEALLDLAADGAGVLVATHDVEFVAGVASRVIVLGDGQVISDGPTADVLAGSPAFAPQVAKILAPQKWLTVDQVTDALARRGEVSA